MVHLITLTFPNIYETSILTVPVLQLGRLRVIVAKGLEGNGEISHCFSLWSVDLC